MSFVIVGVDGSKQGEAAVRFAAEEAALRGAELRIVYVWQFPPFEFQTDEKGSAGVLPGLTRAMSDEGESIVEAAKALATALQPAVHCVSRVVEGDPGPAILKEAQDATLIVLGSLPHGDGRGIRVGSVGNHVLRHASCPVTLVPGD